MSETSLAIVEHPTVENPGALMRQATDVAGVCREIVLRTACQIQKRKYVKCEGWMAIATAHGCIASSRSVERVDGGWTAIGEIRRMSDGVLLSQAEGYVGKDEKRWSTADEYACRAMAQTRAISRACRAAFSHVVVLMDAGLSTTPAEEVPDGGFEQAEPRRDPVPGVVGRTSAKPVQQEMPVQSKPPITFKNASERKARLDAHLLKCKLKLVSDMEIHGVGVTKEYLEKAGHIMPNETTADANELTLFRSVPMHPDDRETDGDWWARVQEAVARDANQIQRDFDSFARGDQLEGAEAADQDAESQAPPLPAGAKQLSGFVKMVNKKPTSKGGTKGGILIVQDMEDREGGEWANTFDLEDIATAERLKGQEVQISYTEDKWGKNLCKHAIVEIN